MIRSLREALVRLATGAVLVAVAVLLCLGAFGWFTVALYLVLKRELDPPLAALLTGLAVVAVAGLLAGIARFSTRKRGHLGRRGAAGVAAAADIRDGAPGGDELAASLGRASAQLIGSHGKSAAFSAFVAGFVVGAKPGLRRNLGRQFLNIFR